MIIKEVGLNLTLLCIIYFFLDQEEDDLLLPKQEVNIENHSVELIC